MMVKRFLAVCGLLLTTPVLADSIDINLHDKAIRGTYAMNLESTKGLDAEVGVLYTEDDANNGETLLHGGLLVSGENWSKSGTFDIAIGGRVVYASPGDLDLLAIAFGGRLRFSPIPRLGIGGHVYVAPEITSFLDSVGYQEVGARLDYQILPQAFVYVGHRNIKLDFGSTNGPTWEMDDEVHVGFKMAF